MTLIKSLLLGSAAGIVAVASAQAADLPTKKGAPAAEYVKVCSINVGGTPIVGFTLPGSDTCLKISGYDSAQYTIAGRARDGQDAFGMFNRAQLNLDAVSNTGAGPLLAHLEFQADFGTGFDSQYNSAVGEPNNRTQANSAYITWAGLTAGKHGSFFDYLAGGPAWDDFISPDHSGGPVPLIAYTASFGGGFAATLSLESPESVNPSYTVLGLAPNAAGGVTADSTHSYSEGFRSPDIVGQVKLTQAWGNAQISGVAHDIEYPDTTGGAGGMPSVGTWGYAVLGGLTFNIPSMAGADVKLQGVYARDAWAYSGLTSFGGFNYGVDGGPYSGTDVVAGADGLWHDTSVWSVAGNIDIPISATFKVTPEASYAEATLSGISGSEDVFVGGGVLEWVPVKNLVFDVDLLYVTGNYNFGAVPKVDFDGFTGKLRIERDF
jgi:hypothetical protein